MLCSRKLQTWTLHTLPREAEAPYKTKPSWTQAEGESAQETHLGEAFVEHVIDTMKEPEHLGRKVGTILCACLTSALKGGRSQSYRSHVSWGQWLLSIKCWD